METGKTPLHSFTTLFLTHTQPKQNGMSNKTTQNI